MSGEVTNRMPRHTLSSILLGGLVAGVFDITYATGFSYLRSGVSPIRVLQSVASGLLGRDSFNGGIPTAALGLFLHFFIALVAAAVYVFASQQFSVLVRWPVLAGVAYGIAIYAFMNLVVIPLSRVPPRPSPPLIVPATGLLVHMFLIGVPIAFAARRAYLAAGP
jgi:uncharacterized membrane protein YagU involved in acid resistance